MVGIPCNVDSRSFYPVKNTNDTSPFGSPIRGSCIFVRCYQQKMIKL